MARMGLFTKLSNATDNTIEKSNASTYKGISIKTLFALLLAIASAVVVAISFNKVFTLAPTDEEAAQSLLYNLLVVLGVCAIVGFISMIIGMIIPRASAVSCVIYAVCEGAFIGAISMIGEIYYHGVVMAASIATVVAFGSMLLIFRLGVIKNKGKLMAFAFGFMLALLVSVLALTLFRIFMPQIASNFWIVIAVEALFLVYACIMLLIDFNQCQMVVEQGLDKHYEWNCALNLLITILYIYVEALRIILIIMDKKN
jgi:uncharacterized YccA/Bax inhibitor family protein